MRRLKSHKALKVAMWLLVACVVLIATCYIVVSVNARGKLLDNVSDVPHCKVGLLLGTSPIGTAGDINLYFVYRIDAAVQLYKAGKIESVLVSGGNYPGGFDEPACMRDSLIAHGVPRDRIIPDYTGVRTLESIMRCKKDYGQDSIIIISQRWHNERAIYLAEHCGVNAVCFNARDVKIVDKWLKNYSREALARVKLFVDIVAGK